jgi:hypothetical protein
MYWKVLSIEQILMLFCLIDPIKVSVYEVFFINSNLRQLLLIC